MLSFCLFFLLAIGSVAAQEVGKPVTLTADLDHPTIIPNFSMALGGAIDGHEEKSDQNILSQKNVEVMLTAGLQPLAYRLRTELGVEAWHWNPTGTWNDAVHHQGYWTSSAQATQPIIKSYGYRLPRRGDTLDEANNDSYSRLDDGDPTTFWKSNPYLTSHYTGEPDEQHPQWVVLDFGKPLLINAARLHWGKPYAKKFRIQFSQGGDLYFGHNKAWHDFPKGHISDGHGGAPLLDLGKPHDRWGHPISVQFIRILMTKSSETAPSGCTDPRDFMGYAVREIELGELQHGVFKDHVIHRPDQKQTMITVSSTDPWHRACDRDEKTMQPGLDAVAISGLGNKKPILWSLPVLYDTPENAVAAVAFLQQRGFLKAQQKIELGEEPDGQHVDPNDFGALYAQVSKKIDNLFLHSTNPVHHCVTSSDVNSLSLQPATCSLQPVLGGPSFVTIDSQPKDTTYRFDHRPWLKRFLKQLKKHHQEKDFQFLTFEWYPFDELLLPAPALLLKQPETLRKAVALIRHGGVPATMPLIITEYGYSVFSGEPEVKLEAALLNADIAAQFLLLGGETSYLYGYEPNTLECAYGNSWGNLMMFLQNEQGDHCEPLPTYYGARLLTQKWGTPADGACEIYPVKSSDLTVTAYLLHRQATKDWSLLIINHRGQSRYPGIPGLTPMVLSRFLRHGKKVSAPWKLSLDMISYSSAQYEWHADGAQGYPSRNEAPRHQKLKGSSVGENFMIAPWSMTVIK